MSRTGRVFAVFVFICVVLGAVAFSRPPKFSLDTRFYLSLADRLQEKPSEVILSTKKATWTILVLPTLLVGARAVAPERWPLLIVGVNVISMALAGVLLVSLVRAVTGSRAAVSGALLLFLGAYDLVVWLRFILTDMIFTALLMGALFAVIQGILQPERATRRRVLLAFLLAANFVARATGAILIPVTIFSEWWAHRSPSKSPVKTLAPWIVVIGIALGAMVARGYFFADMTRWPTDFLRPILEQYAERERSGEVVWDREETYRLPPTSTLDHTVIQLDRFVRFFQFTSSAFSFRHNVLSGVYYGPLYLLALIGVFDGLRGEDRRRRVVTVAVLWIAAVAWLHAITILDFDWRYRLPVLPVLILLAACGIEALTRRLALHRQRPAHPQAEAGTT